MSKESETEKNFGVNLPKWLWPVKQLILADVLFHKVVPALSDAGLYDVETDELHGDLTEEGIENLVSILNKSTILFLDRCTYEQQNDMEYDTSLLAAGITEAVGDCSVEVEGTDMLFKFSGERAFIESIRTPLDVNKLTFDEDGGAASIKMGKHWELKCIIDVTNEFGFKG